MIDPVTLQTADISAPVYWKHPLKPLVSVKQATKYTILDVENTELRKGKYILADATVARSSDFGRNDNTKLIRTHLGNLLNVGDLALGYDVASAVYNEALLAGHKHLELPDVLLFKKTYEKRYRAKKRKWRLQRLNMELDNSMMEPINRRRGGDRSTADSLAMMQHEQEEFMQELEQDKELRSAINLFKKNLTLEDKSMTDASETNNDIEEEDYAEVGVEELLEGLVLDGDKDDSENN